VFFPVWTTTKPAMVPKWAGLSPPAGMDSIVCRVPFDTLAKNVCIANSRNGTLAARMAGNVELANSIRVADQRDQRMKWGRICGDTLGWSVGELAGMNLPHGIASLANLQFLVGATMIPES
jgi:hypothetical protein